jgi:hypothetical protein
MERRNGGYPRRRLAAISIYPRRTRIPAYVVGADVHRGPAGWQTDVRGSCSVPVCHSPFRCGVTLICMSLTRPAIPFPRYQAPVLRHRASENHVSGFLRDIFTVYHSGDIGLRAGPRLADLSIQPRWLFGEPRIPEPRMRVLPRRETSDA